LYQCTQRAESLFSRGSNARFARDTVTHATFAQSVSGGRGMAASFARSTFNLRRCDDEIVVRSGNSGDGADGWLQPAEEREPKAAERVGASDGE
jgi:hypothetical protein